MTSGGKGTKEIATRYPCVDGIIAGTTTQKGHEENLKYSKTIVAKKDRVGL